jgi:hypothetical protein
MLHFLMIVGTDRKMQIKRKVNECERKCVRRTCGEIEREYFALAAK